MIPEFAIDYPPPPRRPPHLAAGSALYYHLREHVCRRGPFFRHFPRAVAGGHADFPDQLSWPAIVDGLMYSGAVMTILLCHEMGHFVQAWRYGVYASLPYFIPMPLTPIGTFGAVIGMEPRRGDRKAVFDIGISGPLAGLVPTFIFLCLGLSWSQLRDPPTASIRSGRAAADAST